MALSSVRAIALVVGFGVALFGVGVHQAWWTIAFAIGGLSVALMRPHVPPVRGLAIGGAITGAGVLGGMSLFLFYGAVWGAGWWLAAAVAALVGALALALLASRLLSGTSSRDVPQH